MRIYFHIHGENFVSNGRSYTLGLPSTESSSSGGGDDDNGNDDDDDDDGTTTVSGNTTTTTSTRLTQSTRSTEIGGSSCMDEISKFNICPKLCNFSQVI